MLLIWMYCIVDARLVNVIILDSCNTYKLMEFEFYWGWLLMIKGIVYILIVFIYVYYLCYRKNTISQIIEKFSFLWYIY